MVTLFGHLSANLPLGGHFAVLYVIDGRLRLAHFQRNRPGSGTRGFELCAAQRTLSEKRERRATTRLVRTADPRIVMKPTSLLAMAAAQELVLMR